MREPRPLGTNQQVLLLALELHGGFWHIGCGWLFGTPSLTISVLDSLEDRGLVSARPYYKATKLYRLIVTLDNDLSGRA